MLNAFLAMFRYFRVHLIVVYSRARIYAERMPFWLILQVCLVQIGNDNLGPKKHFTAFVKHN